MHARSVSGIAGQVLVCTALSAAAFAQNTDFFLSHLQH
jgi:hypothetical protein